ncbi:MAG: hypothetical protein ACO1OF_13875 [Adhaeribacter sp.]
MKNQYNIIIGLALLFTVAACYVFKQHRYFSIKTNEEVTNVYYASYKENDEFKYLIREESYLNYEAGFTAGLTTLGLGFLVIGLINKRKTE